MARAKRRQRIVNDLRMEEFRSVSKTVSSTVSGLSPNNSRRQFYAPDTSGRQNKRFDGHHDISGRQNKKIFPDLCDREDKTKRFFPIFVIGKAKQKGFSRSLRSGRQNKRDFPCGLPRKSRATPNNQQRTIYATRRTRERLPHTLGTAFISSMLSAQIDTP